MQKDVLRVGEKALSHHYISRYQLRQALALQASTSLPLGPLLVKLGFLPAQHMEQACQADCCQDIPSKRLGDLLLAKGWISPQHLADSLQAQKHCEKTLGELLQEKELIHSEQLESALTELLMSRSSHHKRRLGKILTQTQQLSHWQLQQALKAKSQNPGSAFLGEILVERQWLHPRHLKQALRLQKRLLRKMATLFVGTSLLMACKAPVVPNQIPSAGDLRVANSILRSPTAVNGDFRTLSVKDRDQHDVAIRVYKNGSRVVENVPFALQGKDNTCGQAVATMISNFWGIQTDYQALVNQENRFNLATTATALVNSLRNKGLVSQDFREATLENLVAEVNAGRPVITLLDFGSIQNAHYVVVVGYNAERGTLIMHDSLEGAYVEMPQQTFMTMWENKALRNVLPVGGANYRRLMVTAQHPQMAPELTGKLLL